MVIVADMVNRAETRHLDAEVIRHVCGILIAGLLKRFVIHSDKAQVSSNDPSMNYG